MTLRRVSSALALVSLAGPLAGCGAGGGLSLDSIFGDPKPDQPTLEILDPTAQAGIDYTSEIQGLSGADGEDPTEEDALLSGLIEQTARVYTMEDRPPASVALLERRAQSDVGTIERVLKSEGYYKGTASVETDAETDPPGVSFSVEKGPRFTVESHEYVFTPDLQDPLRQEALALGQADVGEFARGETIVNAENAAIAHISQRGRPYAERGDRRAEADWDTNRVRVETDVAAGPNTVYGPITVEGSKRVKAEYIAGFPRWQEGDTANKAQIDAAQRELAASRLFDSVSVSLPEDPPLDADPYVAPVTITVEEGKHRSFGLGASYSTSDGPGVQGYWEHRNLFGEGERFRVGATGALNRQELALEFEKPRFYGPDQSLQSNLSAFRETGEAYDAIGVNFGLGFKRQVNERLSFSVGGAVEVAQTEQNGVKEESYLVGLPLGVTYDSSDDLLDPTEGIRAQLAIAPWAGVYRNTDTYFGVADGAVSGYYAVDEAKRYVLAARARGAVLYADDIQNVPPQRRLYSGGGGSVRGFGSQMLGPLDSGNNPIGGMTVGELGLEGRIRFGSFGVVPFVDAGIVGDEFFDGFDEVRYSAGLGARYYSPVGPIRLDVAIPINKRDVDDNFQVYFSIGQAF